MSQLDKPKLDTLPRDVIIQIALGLDLPELLSYCRLSKKFNDTVCKNNDFWFNKLEKDYGVTIRGDNLSHAYTIIKDFFDDNHGSAIILENPRKKKATDIIEINNMDSLKLFYMVVIGDGEIFQDISKSQIVMDLNNILSNPEYNIEYLRDVIDTDALGIEQRVSWVINKNSIIKVINILTQLGYVNYSD